MKALICGLSIIAFAGASSFSLEDLRPGLGEIMSVIQSHHAKLYYAGAASNWELADYELDEVKEGLESAAKLHPHFKTVKVPLTDLIPAMTKIQLEQVSSAVKARDRKAFVKGFQALTVSCNKCHQAADHGFIVIQTPTTPGFPNQKFSK